MAGIGNTKHKLSKHPLYRKWTDIKTRCLNPNYHEYYLYGGVGIRMYADWVNDFKSFYDYVVNLPNYGVEGLTLDRIKGYKDYAPGNLRWASIYVQNTNQRVRSDNTSGHKGVNFSNRMNKWVVRVSIMGSRKYVGSFLSLSDAVIARDDYLSVKCNKVY